MTTRTPTDETMPAQRVAIGRSSHALACGTAKVANSINTPAAKLVAMVSPERLPPFVSTSDSHAVPELAM